MPMHHEVTENLNLLKPKNCNDAEAIHAKTG